MSENENAFDPLRGTTPQASIGSTETPVVASQLQSQTASPQQIAYDEVQRIQTRRITGPLVVFFGPSEIGKTVTLLRLCSYISNYEIRPDEHFRTDADYAVTVAAFEAMRANMQFAPASTGNINFLLLNVTYGGNSFCQILESPGEHFFDRRNPSRAYPDYMNRILNADDYRKVFVFFFELNMFSSDADLEKYTNKIAQLVNGRISPRRDRVIIVCNKCDLHPGFFRGGRPVKSEFRRAIYTHPAFNKLKDVLRRGGFGYIPFVTFSSGTFNDDGTGQLAFALSPDFYPKELWQEIHDSIEGSKSLWQKLISLIFS